MPFHQQERGTLMKVNVKKQNSNVEQCEKQTDPNEAGTYTVQICIKCQCVQ